MDFDLAVFLEHRQFYNSWPKIREKQLSSHSTIMDCSISDIQRMDLPTQSGEHLCQNPPQSDADLLPEKGDKTSSATETKKQIRDES